MVKTDNEKQKTVQATETSFAILETLQSLGAATLTDLSQELELPKSTLHNHLWTLIKNEYVVKEDKKYHVSLKFLQFGDKARKRRLAYNVARPKVDELSEKTNEIANLVFEEHGRGVFVYRSKGSEAVQMDTHAGKRVKLHATAFGKTILANLSEERVEEIIEKHGLPVRTENTITDKESLYNELDQVAEQGYALDDEERLNGLRCVSAPIVADENKVLGAVSISGPASRIRGDLFHEELPTTVKNTASVIEINITYSRPSDLAQL